MQAGAVRSDMLSYNSSKRTHQANVTYRVNKIITPYESLSLVDHACNGGMASTVDMVQLAMSEFQKVDATGIYGVKQEDISVGTDGSKIISDKGPIIC